MAAEIQRADPLLRVRFLIAMTVVALLLALGILYLDAYLRELPSLAREAKPLAAAKAMRAVRTVLALLSTGAAVLCFRLGRTSWRSLISERYPPPGARVISDTRIRRGRQARRYGQAGLVMAGLTILITLLIVVRADRMFRQLLDTTLKPTPYHLPDSR